MQFSTGMMTTGIPCSNHIGDSMNLITFTFDLHPDEQKSYITALEELKSRWDKHGLIVSLFQDMNDRNRFLLFFLTEKSVDEISEMMVSHPDLKALFGQLKESEGRVVVSAMEQVL